jgi:hypothetical protein
MAADVAKINGKQVGIIRNTDGTLSLVIPPPTAKRSNSTASTSSELLQKMVDEAVASERIKQEEVEIDGENEESRSSTNVSLMRGAFPKTFISSRTPNPRSSTYSKQTSPSRQNLHSAFR